MNGKLLATCSSLCPIVLRRHSSRFPALGVTLSAFQRPPQPLLHSPVLSIHPECALQVA